MVAEEARFCSRCGVPVRREGEGDVPDELREALKVALGRQYEVVRFLGKGGMGAVYLARETFLERYVAIKVLPPNRGATEESRERFRRESRTAARLSHPKIFPLHTFGEVDGLLYFVMGFVKGESLGARLRREGRLDPDEARRLLLEVASALEHAHGLGIVHRDVKPDNVLIEKGTGQALLTDLGVAKSQGTDHPMTVAGAVLRTPHFMSPEQAQGRSDIGPPSDLYSLGVLGYAMLAGRLTFDGGTPGDVLLQHITAEVPPLSARAPGVPVAPASAITRCLAEDPAARWPNAGRLRSALAPPDDAELPQPLDELRESASLGLVFCTGVLYLGAWRAGGGPGSLPAVLLPASDDAGLRSRPRALGDRERRLRRERSEHRAGPLGDRKLDLSTRKRWTSSGERSAGPSRANRAAARTDLRPGVWTGPHRWLRPSRSGEGGEYGVSSGRGAVLGEPLGEVRLVPRLRDVLRRSSSPRRS